MPRRMLRNSIVCNLNRMRAAWCCLLVLPTVGCSDGGRPARSVASAPGVYRARGPYSPIVRYGNWRLLSGVLPLEPGGNALRGANVEEQTRVVLDYIGAELRADGLGYRNVLSTTVYLTDLNDFAAMNAAYAKYFEVSPPARTTVAVSALPLNAKVEVSVIAAE